jgi:hypothetical protein
MNCRTGLNLRFRRLKFLNYIFKALADDFNIKPAAKIVWLGGKPSVEYFTKSKRKLLDMSLTFHDKRKFTIQTNKQEGEWLVMLDKVIALRF